MTSLIFLQQFSTDQERVHKNKWCLQDSKDLTGLNRGFHGGEVNKDVVDVTGHEGHQESHCDQVDGNHLPCCLQNIRIDIETPWQRLWLLLIPLRNSVKHVGIHRVALHLEFLGRSSI